MDKTINNTHIKNTLSQTLLLSDRKQLSIDSIAEVKRTNNTEIILILVDKSVMTILGNNINITKLDIEKGSLEASGIFDSITYGSKQNIFKRIFK